MTLVLLPSLLHAVWLLEGESIDPERLPELGGKAATLLRLAQAGFPVLPSLVLLPSAFELSRPGPDALPRRLDPLVGRELQMALEVLERLAQRTLGGACWAGRGGRRWAVRSSGRCEDGEQASYAGQYVTRLDVEDAAVEEAIVAVWRSAFGSALVTYRRERGLPESTAAAAAGEAPAVLIQPMLAPRFAGVAFSADPVSGRRGVTLVQSTVGVAAALVAGAVEGETWLFDREGRRLEHRPAPQPAPEPGASAPAAHEAADAASTPDSSDRLLHDSSLPEGEARRIAGLARRLGHHFGVPQDVEWALVEGGALWVLQSRPITTLRGLDDPDGRLALWDNSNIVESYGGVTTPLTFSFARKAYSEVYAQFCRFMGVREATIRRNRAVFGGMIGFLEGRIYYNLLNWYRVLALLPGYRLNARFLEQMLGVKHGLPEERMEQIRLQQRREAAEDPSPRWRDALHLARSLAGLVANALTLRHRSRAFRRRLDRVLLNPTQRAALADARPDELVHLYRRIEAELLNHWDAPLINDFYAMIVYGLLRGLAQRWCPSQANALHDWIAGDPTVISAEPPRRIRAMAVLLQQRPDLVESLQRGDPSTLQSLVASCPELQAEVARYLDDFGDRCLEELKLETLTLREDPLPLLRSIGAMAERLGRSSPPPGRPSESERLQRAAASVAPRLPGQPLRSLLLRWLQGRTRALVSNRENLRFERTRVFGLARRLLMELGRRLAALGLLDQAEDVVYLEVEEALGVVEGNGSGADLRGLVALRREAWKRQLKQRALPRRLETRGLPALAAATLLAAPELPVENGEGMVEPGASPARHWQGLGCAPGLVRAQVSLVSDPRRWLDAPRQRGSDSPILVAASTDPGWVLLFPHAAGLLVERGSVLSHVAIVARELGLPMVSDLGGITASLVDGDWVEMDGRSGLVRRLADVPGGAEPVVAPSLVAGARQGMESSAGHPDAAPAPAGSAAAGAAQLVVLPLSEAP